MKNKINEIIFNSLWEIATIILVFVVITIPIWKWKPDTLFEFQQLYPCIVIPSVVAVILIKVIMILLKFTKEDTNTYPKVKQVILDSDLLILEPSEKYPIQTLVTIYYKENNHVSYAGFGYVESIIDETKNIQIKIKKINREILTLNPQHKNFIVKPMVTLEFYQMMSNNNAES